MSDAALFMPEGSAVWNQFSSGMGGLIPAITLLGGVLLMFVLLALLPPVRAPSQRLLLAAVLVVCLTAGAVMEPPPYVNEWAVDNVFAANLATTERVLYSDEVAASILSLPRQQTRVDTLATTANRNVILVLLESWSPWHSALFGGYEDWTPGLDRAAREGLRFTPGEMDDHVYSQADLAPSFELWLNGTSQLDSLQTVMFGNPSRRAGMVDSDQQNCAFHSRGDRAAWSM